MSRLCFVFFLGLWACADPLTVSDSTCDVEILAVSPDAGSPGETIALTARPLTTTFDTAVHLDSTRASVVNVSREGCESCDSCREEENCAVCGDCDSCDTSCKATCVEQLEFIVPELAPGAVTVRVTNQHGASGGLTFTIAAPADTGSTTDTGPSDTGP
jgi:hypothetical protein